MANESENLTKRISRCIDPPFDAYFGVQMSILFATEFCAVIFNASFLRALLFSVSVQPNVRLLLQNISTGFLIIALTGICELVYTVLVLSTGYQNVFRTPALCVLFETPGTLGISCVIFSFFFISVERLVGTFKNTKLMEMEKTGIVVKIIMALTWLVGVPAVVEPLMQSRNRKVCYCSLSFITRDTDLYITSAAYILIEVMTIVLYPTVTYLNKRELKKFDLNSDTHSLSDRSRAWRNVRVTIMLLPSAVLQGILLGLVLVLKIPSQEIVFNINLADGLDIRLSMLWAQLLILFCITHPILCVRRNQLLAETVKQKSLLLSYFVRSAKVDVVGKTEKFELSPDTHQNQLLDFWETSRLKKNNGNRY